MLQILSAEQDPNDFFYRMNTSLENKSWFYQENALDKDLCNLIQVYIQQVVDADHLKKAQIGKGLNQTLISTIRSSEISWIEDWNSNDALISLNNFYEQMRLILKEYFFLAIKRFESQIAIYKEGDFYKIHLDQFQEHRHRQVSCCLYFNDCNEGGELVLYKKDSNKIIDQIIKPKVGSIAIFFSGHIHHEVKLVHSKRYSMTTWFRDDII